MTPLALALTLVFVLIPLALSKTLGLRLERDTMIATIRSIVQLLLVGFVLQFVFDSESYLFIVLMVALMIAAAVQNARKKGGGIRGITWKLAVTFVAIELLTTAATRSVCLGFLSYPSLFNERMQLIRLGR
ncbi:inner membrane protein [Bacillus sp. OxB-1]|uniref:ABC transporter permease n=1 Tax=Bacillales TaxID=1385 RepID=UPI000581D228|nr:inner membrane protein [Bacillus sp. OxB-1]